MENNGETAISGEGRFPEQSSPRPAEPPVALAPVTAWDLLLCTLSLRLRSEGGGSAAAFAEALADHRVR